MNNEIKLTSSETQQIIADYELMTSFPKTAIHNQTIYRIQRKTKWTNKKVFVLFPYATQCKVVEFAEWVKPSNCEMVTKIDFDNEEYNRGLYQKGLNISLTIACANKDTASRATDKPFTE